MPRRWSRHPSYAGFLYWALGTQLVLQNPFSFGVYLVLLMRFFSSRIIGERRLLQASTYYLEPSQWRNAHWSLSSVMLTSRIETKLGLEYLSYRRMFLSHITQLELSINAWTCCHKRGKKCRIIGMQDFNVDGAIYAPIKSVLKHRCLIRDIYPVQKLANVLVSYSTNALDGCRWEYVRTSTTRQ